LSLLALEIACRSPQAGSTMEIMPEIVCGPRGGKDRIVYLAGMNSQSFDASAGPMMITNITPGVGNIVSDLYPLILSLPAIIKLRVPPRKKSVSCSSS